MEIIPAIDLMNGKVVRLIRGDPATSKTYEHLGDPVTVARRWQSEGASSLHVVDLDAALGVGSNTRVIKAIVDSTNVPVQVGGGIGSLDVASVYLNMGIERVILGSLALENPHQVKLISDDFGSDRVVVALDHLHGTVMVRGWKSPTNVGVEAAVSKFSALGVKFFLLTAIAKDGTLMGPDFKTLDKMRDFEGVRTIAAGGISSLEDLINLKRMGVYGVVIGKALYEGKIGLRDALRIAE